MRPLAGVVPAALEVGQARDVGHAADRQAAGGGDDDARAHLVADVGAHRPQPRVLVPISLGDAGLETDVAQQVIALGRVADVGLDLALLGVALGPLPFLLQIFGPRIAVLQALDVAARTGVAVPVPGAADIIAGLEGHGRQAQAAQAVQHVQAGETGADDDRVGVQMHRHAGPGLPERAVGGGVLGLMGRGHGQSAWCNLRGAICVA